jgi:tetratricopeptide (TPR) repeat protein
LQDCLKHLPDDAEAHYFLALAFSQTGDQRRAESELRESVRLNSTNIQTQEMLAGIAAGKNDSATLMQIGEQVIKIAPGLPNGYSIRAAGEIAHKDLKAAEADLTKALQLSPNDPHGYMSMARFRLGQKNLPEAEKFFEEALKRNPAEVDALQGLAAIYFAQKHPERAMARVNEQIAKIPNNASVYGLKGSLQLQAKDAQGALASFKQAVGLSGNKDLNLLLLLAQTQVALGSYDDALATFGTAAKAFPNNPRPLVLGAMLQEERGNWQAAQKQYEAALSQSQDAISANNLAFLLASHGGNLDVALSWAQKARQWMPENPTTADTLGWVYYQKGLYNMAIQLFQEAADKDVNHPAYYYHLGFAQQRAGEKSKAKASLTKALKLDPKFGLAAEAHKALNEL